MQQGPNRVRQRSFSLFNVWRRMSFYAVGLESDDPDVLHTNLLWPRFGFRVRGGGVYSPFSECLNTCKAFFMHTPCHAAV